MSSTNNLTAYGLLCFEGTSNYTCLFSIHLIGIDSDVLSVRICKVRIYLTLGSRYASRLIQLSISFVKVRLRGSVLIPGSYVSAWQKNDETMPRALLSTPVELESRSGIQMEMT